MQSLRSLGVLILVASCSLPGARPEGRIVTISGSAPATADAVMARVTQWLGRNAYTVQSETDRGIVAYRDLGREGEVVTRALVEFAVRRATDTQTDYAHTHQVVRGVPPILRAIDYSGSVPTASSSLDSWLSCGSARWPGCP